jgi:dihydrofolate reductase
MPLSLIVAMTRSGVIGRGGILPWKISADLRRFRALTMGHAIIMGRKTFESLGRPLPGRTSVVVTRQAGFRAPPEVLVAQSLAEALHRAAADDRPFVIGGAEIYAQALEQVSDLYVTWVEAEIEGDTHFPPIDWRDWREASCERHSADAKNQYDYTFCTYHRLAKEPR